MFHASMVLEVDMIAVHEVEGFESYFFSDLSKTKQSPSPLQQDHQPKSTKEDKAVLPKYKVSSTANVEQENEEVKYEDFVKDLRGDNKLAKETIQESKVVSLSLLRM